jgi:hypothetical protein
MAIFALSDTDLAAIGGASTFVLAAVAVAQTRHSGRQIEALRGQVEASIAQGEAVREGARAQLQPIVFPRLIQPGTLRGPHPMSLRDGEVGLCYRLANEGTALALSVEHGIEIDDKSFASRPYPCIRPGESVPKPLSPEEIKEAESMVDFVEFSGQPLTVEGFVLAVPEDELPPKWG